MIPSHSSRNIGVPLSTLNFKIAKTIIVIIFYTQIVTIGCGTILYAYTCHKTAANRVNTTHLIG